MRPVMNVPMPKRTMRNSRITIVMVTPWRERFGMFEERRVGALEF